jgi:polyhydroxyalkanoate synthesis repressor PhaR
MRDMSRNPVIIKKYENRRLYDTTNSRYINQDEVARMLQNGYEVQVVDAATGEDLTRLVLTQIIVEQAKAPDSAFPLDILRQMVIASSRATQESTLQYMKAVLDMYQNAYHAMAPKLNPFEFMQPPAVRAAPPVDFPPSDAAIKTRGMRAPRGTEAGEDDVDELKRRVAELESLVSKRRTTKKAGKRKASSHPRA